MIEHGEELSPEVLQLRGLDPVLRDSLGHVQSANLGSLAARKRQLGSFDGDYLDAIVPEKNCSNAIHVKDTDERHEPVLWPHALIFPSESKHDGVQPEVAEELFRSVRCR
jgi:hypothetical protein